MQGREFARGRLGGGEFGQILFKMATNLSDFRGQKIAFVFEWLQENGLVRLKQVFEGKKLYFKYSKLLKALPYIIIYLFNMLFYFHLAQSVC